MDKSWTGICLSPLWVPCRQWRDTRFRLAASTSWPMGKRHIANWWTGPWLCQQTRKARWTRWVLSTNPSTTVANSLLDSLPPPMLDFLPSSSRVQIRSNIRHIRKICLKCYKIRRTMPAQLLSKSKTWWKLKNLTSSQAPITWKRKGSRETRRGTTQTTSTTQIVTTRTWKWRSGSSTRSTLPPPTRSNVSHSRSPPASP